MARLYCFVAQYDRSPLFSFVTHVLATPRFSTCMACNGRGGGWWVVV